MRQTYFPQARVVGLCFFMLMGWACGSASLTATPLAPTSTPLGPRAVTVREGDSTTTFTTTATTLGEALWQADFRLYVADAIEPPLDTALITNTDINLIRARPVTVIADGHTLFTRTRQATVGALLSEMGVALVGLDYSAPALTESIPDIIRIVRVQETVLATQETLPYETFYEARAEWEIDTVQAVQAGRPGLKERRVRVRYEDGVEVSRVDEGEVIVQTPQAYVIAYGTNIVLRTLDTPNGPVEYWRSYTMYATSYAAKYLSRPPESPNYGRTASGKILTQGLVAIDRNLMPFGTRMYVPGYGFAEAADTGGGVRGRWIDLGYDDWNYTSWHQVVTVYFIAPAPPADQIRWIIPSTVP